jgi:hypothetical protein
VYEVGYEVMSLIDGRLGRLSRPQLRAFRLRAVDFEGEKVEETTLEDYFVDFLIVSSTFITPPTLPIQPRDPAHLKFLPK